MRSIVLLPLAAALLAPSPATSQTALPVTVAADSMTSSYDASGIRVIHRIAPRTDIVVANLYMLGGVRQVTPETAGIEPFLLEASERGTRTHGKDRLRRAMARLGTSIVVDAQSDWTSLGMRATKETFDSTWAIFAGRIGAPTLDPAEVDIVRAQFMAAVRQRRDSPDAYAEFLVDSFAFNGHPYAIATSGTERSIAGMTAPLLREYVTNHMVKSRMLLVVVGDVSRASVERLVSATLGKLPAGAYKWTLPDTLPRARSSVSVSARMLPTNYILGRFPGPPAGTRDYQALRLACAVLSGQLFGEIRSRRNLTYAVEAPFTERAVASGGLYVTTVQPDITIEVMRQQMATLREGYIDPEALTRLVQQFITQYYLDNESNAEQADLLARAYLYSGDFRAADRFVDELRAVTPEDIRRAAQRYMRNVQWVFLGDARRVPQRTMERF
jgi:zinc protease